MFAPVNTQAIFAPSYGYAAVSAPVSGEATLGRLPSAFVHSAVALPALNNQRESNAAAPAPLAQTAPQNSAQTTLFNLAALGRPGNSPDFSSAFFTQLLAQSSAATQASIATSYVGSLRAGDPEILTAFSNVKYMPSAAAKPQPQSYRVDPLPAQQVPNAAPSEQQIRVAQQQQQVQQQAAAPQMERNFSTIVMRNSFSYAPVAAVPQRRSENQTEDTLRRDRSFLPKEASAAYARAATYAITPKPVEAVDKANTD